MSRLITICSILAAILTLSFGGIAYAKGTRDDFNGRISQARELCQAEDQEGLANAAEEMRKAWKDREGFLSFYVRHDEIERMETNLVGLRSHAENGSYESALNSLAQIQFQVNHIYERELLNLDNLF